VLLLRYSHDLSCFSTLKIEQPTVINSCLT